MSPAVVAFMAGAAMAAEATANPGVAETEALISRLVQESQKYRVQRKADPQDPVWQAEQRAADLADDIPIYNEWMLKVIRAYALRGDYQEAAYVADQLPGSGSALAHAELAVMRARARETQDAERHLAAARQGLSTALRLQADLIRSHCAHALRLLNRDQEAREIESLIEENERLHLETRLHEENLLPALMLPQAQARLDGMKAKAADEAKCRYLLACATQQFKKGAIDSGLPFLPVVGAIASENGLPSAQHVLVALAKTAWMAGQTQDARKALNLFLKICETYADHAEWKAPYLADAAAVLLDWKEPEEARAWLKLAEASLPKVFVLDAPAAILAVGHQMERLEGPAAGDKFAIMAAEAGMTHPHPRAQAAAAVRISLRYAELGRPLPAAVSAILSPHSKEENK